MGYEELLLSVLKTCNISKNYWLLPATAAIWQREKAITNRLNKYNQETL
jgi:hypothetical protein